MYDKMSALLIHVLKNTLNRIKPKNVTNEWCLRQNCHQLEIPMKRAFKVRRVYTKLLHLPFPWRFDM